MTKSKLEVNFWFCRNSYMREQGPEETLHLRLIRKLSRQRFLGADVCWEFCFLLRYFRDHSTWFSSLSLYSKSAQQAMDSKQDECQIKGSEVMHDMWLLNSPSVPSRSQKIGHRSKPREEQLDLRGQQFSNRHQPGNGDSCLFTKDKYFWMVAGTLWEWKRDPSKLGILS